MKMSWQKSFSILEDKKENINLIYEKGAILNHQCKDGVFHKFLEKLGSH
jgi:hypothetical protein